MITVIAVCRSRVEKSREGEHETHSSDTEEHTAERRRNEAASESVVETVEI